MIGIIPTRKSVSPTGSVYAGNSGCKVADTLTKTPVNRKACPWSMDHFCGISSFSPISHSAV